MAITNATITTGSSKTISKMKAENGNNALSYVGGVNSETNVTALTAGHFYSDVKVVDASALGAKANLDADLTGANLTSFTGGKGSDTILAYEGVGVINGGSGKDVFVISDTTKAAVIGDYAAGQDTIQVAGNVDVAFEDYDFVGKNVKLNLADRDNDSIKTSVTIKNAKGNLITIVDSDSKVVFTQSFQVGGVGSEGSYEATDKNTGADLYSSAAYIDASGRGKDLAINATATDYAQLIDGGKKNDVFNVAYTGNDNTTITTGKGNDTVNVVNGNHIVLTDYQIGNAKEVIHIGTDIRYYDYRISGNDVLLKFSDTSLETISVGYGVEGKSFNPKKDDPSATVLIKDALWDQIKPAKKYQVSVVDDAGATVAGTNVYQDPSILYVTKVGKTEANADLTKDSVVGTGFKLDSDTVDSIVFTPGTAVSIKAGGGYAAVTGGGGKDTMLGGDVAFDEAKANPATDTAAKTRNDMTVVASNPVTANGKTTVKMTITGRYGEAHMNVIYEPDAESVNRPSKLEDADAADKDGHSKEVDKNSSNGSAELTVGKYFLQLKNLNDYSFRVYVGDTAGMNKELANAASNIADVINTTGYKYVYDISQTSLIGGKGNDYLYGNVSGGRLYGDIGNDTLRGGSQTDGSTKIDEDDPDSEYVKIGGNAYMEGGAGNDTFLLTGEGPATIGDYNSGLAGQFGTEAKADANNRKKELGSDVITIQYDKYNKKNLDNTYLGRASLKGSTFVTDGEGSTVVATDTDGYGYLKLNVSGQGWVPTETVSAEEIAEGKSSVVGHFDDEIRDAGEYYIKVKSGDQITIQEQGQKYTQFVDFSGATEVTVGANYLGLANPDVVKIDGKDQKKNMRLVAGAKTTEIIGGAKNDTLIGTTSGENNYTLTGGAGNDVFVVDSGKEDAKDVVITDYDGLNLNKLGKDKIQVNSIYNLAEAEGEQLNVENVETAQIADAAYSYTLKKQGSDDSAGTIKVKVEASYNEGWNFVKYNYNESTGEYEEAENGDFIHITSVDTTAVSGLSQVAYAVKANTYVLASDDNGEAAIRELVDMTTYVADVEGKYSNAIVGDDVQIGGMLIQGAAAKINNKSQAITFQQIDEVVSYDKKTGEASGSKNVVSTMIRSFSADEKDSVVSGGASTYLEIFAGDIDSSVVVVKASSKGGTLVNGGDNVNSIVGGGKIDSIVVGNNANEEITVSTGGGNDVIVWNGQQDVVVTDYTAAKYNNKGVFSGDVIQLDGYKFEQKDLKYDGDDVILSHEVNGVTSNLTLKKAKGKDIYIATETFVATSALASIDGKDMGGTVGSANIHEYIVDAKAGYGVAGVHTVSADDWSYGVTNIINNSAGKAAADIQLNLADYSAVTTLYGGKGADTINAKNPKLIDAGAGNDVIYLNAGTPANNLTVKGGAGNDFLMIGSDTKNVQVADYTTTADKLVLNNDYYITGVTATAGDTITSGKGKNATTITSSDVTIAVANAEGDEGVVVLKTLAPDTKITRSADGTAGKAYYSLDYLSDEISITAKDVKGAVVDVTGVTANTINVDKAASISLEGAAGKTVNVDAASTKAVYYISGNSDTSAATITFAGGKDVYVGNGASDTVVLGGGQNTVQGAGNMASIVSGADKAKNVFVATGGSNYSIDKFSAANDQILFEDAAKTNDITSIAVSEDGKTLDISYSITSTVSAKTYTTTGNIKITNYDGGKVTFGALDISGKKPKTVTFDEVHSYTAGDKLELDDADGSVVTFDGRWNQNVTTADASARTAKKAINISIDAEYTDSKVQTLIGGKGADTLSAFATSEKAITYTGGDGNDTFIINTGTLANYTITDYKKGDIIYSADKDLFSSIVNYSADYEISGDDIILSGGEGKADVILKGAKGQAITFSNDGTKRTVTTLADPVNVALAKADTVLSWTLENTAVDVSRVKTFDATAANGAVTFEATGADFTTFKSAKKDATVTIGESVSGGVEITVGAAKNTINLNESGKADTITIDKGTTGTAITNFDSTDKIAGVTTADIKKNTTATVDKDNNKVTYTLNKGTLEISGDGVVFSESDWADGKAKEAGKTADTDTFVWTKTYSVKVEGFGSVNYSTTTKESTGNVKPDSTDSSGASGENSEFTFNERYSIEEFVSDYVVSDDLSEITSAKVAVSADDLKTGLNDKTGEFVLKVTTSSGNSGSSERKYEELV